MNAAETNSPRAFSVLWKDLDRWSVNSFHSVSWRWPASDIKPLSSALRRLSNPVNRESFEVRPEHIVSLRFTGEIEPRELHGKSEFKGMLFFARAGSIIYSKIDVRNGAIGIIPAEIPVAVVTSEFPVYAIKSEVALPEYIQLVFRTSHFRKIINTMVSGTSGRKRVQPRDLEKVKVPIPSRQVQAAIVRCWHVAHAKVEEAQSEMLAASIDLNIALESKTNFRSLETPLISPQLV